MHRIVLTYIFFAAFIHDVKGHGRLWEPPGRSTAWRRGFETPINYNDHQLFCGGRSVQHDRYGGKCGFCGDPWEPLPRPHEAGGVYASGTIVKNYQAGAVIEVTVDLTVYHGGWHEFRLCKNDNIARPITQECLDEHLLPEVTTGETRFFMDEERAKKFSWSLQLPTGLTCTQCVLQWKWNCGNSWGSDSEGTGLGFGPQEQFYGCADIAIAVPTTEDRTNASTPAPSTAEPSTLTTASVKTEATSGTTGTTVTTTKSSENSSPEVQNDVAPGTTTTLDLTGHGTYVVSVANSRCRSTGLFKDVLGMTDWCITNCAQGNCPSGLCTCDNIETTTALPECRAVGAFATVSGMTDWCITNCAQGNCPSGLCTCDNIETTTALPECRAVGAFANVPGMTDWCITNCAEGNCPSTHCACGGIDATTAQWACRAAGAYTNAPGMTAWCITNCAAGNCPATHCECGDPSATTPSTRLQCRPVPPYDASPGMGDWCDNNCNHNPPYCPFSHCECGEPGPTTTPSRLQCRPVPPYDASPGMGDWCDNNCNHNPPYCPLSHCECGDPGPTTPPSRLQCRPVPPYDAPGMEDWCNNNCNHNPPYCPTSHCDCESSQNIVT